MSDYSDLVQRLRAEAYSDDRFGWFAKSELMTAAADAIEQVGGPCETCANHSDDVPGEDVKSCLDPLPWCLSADAPCSTLNNGCRAWTPKEGL